MWARPMAPPVPCVPPLRKQVLRHSAIRFKSRRLTALRWNVLPRSRAGSSAPLPLFRAAADLPSKN